MEDFLQGYLTEYNKEDYFFTLPSSSSQIFCINDRPKLLQDFMAKNYVHSTLIVPHLKTLICAKQMLELNFQIEE